MYKESVAVIGFIAMAVGLMWFTLQSAGLNPEVLKAEQTAENIGADVYEIAYETSTQLKASEIVIVTNIEKTDNKIVYTLLDNGLIEVSDSYTSWERKDGSIDTLSNATITKKK